MRNRARHRVLRVDDGKKQQSLYIDQGFAQIVDDKLTILTEQARGPTSDW